LFVGEIIPFRRIKTIVVERLAIRFATVERTPPKSNEMRMSRPVGRINARLTPTVQLDSLGDLKFVQRTRRHGKMQLFRMWKLFGEVKAIPAEMPLYRQVAERIRVAGSAMRL